MEARRRHRQGQADQRLSRRPRGGEYGKAGRHQTQQRGGRTDAKNGLHLTEQ